MFSLLFTLPGAPVIYYGDEIGMGDNIWLPDRNGVRTPMQWDDTLNAGFSVARDLPTPVIDDPVYGYHRVNVRAQWSDPNSLLQRIRQFIHVARAYPLLATGDMEVIQHDEPALFAFYRTDGTTKVLCLHNLGESALQISTPAGADLLTGERIGPGPLQLPAFGFRWIKV